MSCDLCHCDDHPNEPCANCLNCVGHYVETADPDQDHTEQSTEYTENSPTVEHKPHYRYNARTGQVTEVTDIISESFGL